VHLTSIANGTMVNVKAMENVKAIAELTLMAQVENVLKKIKGFVNNFFKFKKTHKHF